MLNLFALLMSMASATTHVVFFGGFASRPADIACWTKSASAVGTDFVAFPYPAGAKSDYASAVKGGAKTVAALAAKIRSSQDTFVIVGHSSGMAIANSLMDKLPSSKKIRVVALDGFAPSSAIQTRFRADCWASENGNMKSRNYSAMRACKNSHTYEDHHCRTQWCLHFSLVNRNDPPDLGPYPDFERRGYAACSTNLEWL